MGPRSPGLRNLAGRQVRHSRKLRRAPIRSEFGKMRSSLVFWIYCPACVLVAAVVVVGIVALIV